MGASPHTTVLCGVTYPDGTGFNAWAHSLFEGCADALKWVEVDRRDFGTSRQFRDDEVLDISVHQMGKVTNYRVRIGRVREWVRDGR